MREDVARILITGANGHLGRQLVARLVDGGRGLSAHPLRALVRSERAAETVRSASTDAPVEIVVGDYTSEDSMRRAIDGVDTVVHLVGIIKEGGGATYVGAHEDTCRVLARVAGDADVRRIVYLSIFGSRPESDNTCLASKGRAEAILLSGRAPATVLRVPMVLGPEDYASVSLAAQARARVSLMVGGGTTIQQPIDSRDVIAAIVAALADSSRESVALDLAGPERLCHHELVARAARLYRRSGPLIVPLPLFVARSLVSLIQRISSNPPITRAMLDILQHDDRIDEAEACRRLGLTLISLDETLKHCVGPERSAP